MVFIWYMVYMVYGVYALCVIWRVLREFPFHSPRSFKQQQVLILSWFFVFSVVLVTFFFLALKQLFNIRIFLPQKQQLNFIESTTLSYVKTGSTKRTKIEKLYFCQQDFVLDQSCEIYRQRLFSPTRKYYYFIFRPTENRRKTSKEWDTNRFCKEKLVSNQLLEQNVIK